MNKVVINNRTGIMPSSKLTVEDENGFIIYLAEEGHKFNLPQGTYYMNGGFSFADFIPYPESLEKLPEDEKPGGNKEIRKVVFAPNVPGIAFTQAQKGLIVIDESIERGPTFIRDFVYLHEVGHMFYKGPVSEWKCDVFAMVHMIRAGWNPSQVKVASGVLKSKKRKLIVSESLEIFKR